MAEPDRTELLDLEHQVCFALAVASRNVIALYRPLLEPMGLTHSQYLVMLALWQYGPLSLRELTTWVASDAATLSPMVKRLADHGYVTRTRDPGDERTLCIALTKRGRELRKEALKIPPAIMATLDMDLGELNRVHALLTDLIQRAKTANG